MGLSGLLLLLPQLLYYAFSSHQLATVQVAEKCMWRAKDLSGLLLLYYTFSADILSIQQGMVDWCAGGREVHVACQGPVRPAAAAAAAVLQILD